MPAILLHTDMLSGAASQQQAYFLHDMTQTYENSSGTSSCSATPDCSSLPAGVSARYSVDNVGTAAAALAAFQALTAFHPDLVISIGTAGGFKARGAQIGDVFVGTQTLNHDRRIAIPVSFLCSHMCNVTSLICNASGSSVRVPCETWYGSDGLQGCKNLHVLCPCQMLHSDQQVSQTMKSFASSCQQEDAMRSPYTSTL